MIPTERSFSASHSFEKSDTMKVLASSLTKHDFQAILRKMRENPLQRPMQHEFARQVNEPRHDSPFTERTATFKLRHLDNRRNAESLRAKPPLTPCKEIKLNLGEAIHSSKWLHYHA